MSCRYAIGLRPMADDKITTVGSGITTRCLESWQPKTDEEWAEARSGFAAMWDWNAYTADAIAWANSVVDSLRGQPRENHWNERAGQGWYAQQLLNEHRSATQHKDGGDLSGAMCAAVRFGELRTEARLKFRWDKSATGSARGGKKGGLAEKRKKWAEALAEYLATRATTETAAFALIPESDNPLELWDEYKVYQDADRICCVDAVTDKDIGLLARSSFFTRYFRKARKAAH